MILNELNLYMNTFFLYSVTTKYIILGVISIEILTIVVLYLYYLLMPEAGTIYYKKAKKVDGKTTYEIRIKRYTFGYPFVNKAFVTKEVFERYTYGDNFNIRTYKLRG